MKTKEIKIWPAKLGIIVLAITIFPWEYGVYMVGKFIIFIIAIYYCYSSYQKEKEKQRPYFWYFLVTAILYNPLLPIHLFYRTLWIIVDIALIILLVNYTKYLGAAAPSLNSSSDIFCKSCGSKNDSKFYHCSNCGQKLST